MPVCHARLVRERLGQIHRSSVYEELPGKGHWIDGVMTTKHLRAFYSAAVNRSRKTVRSPGEFTEKSTITVPSSGDLDPRLASSSISCNLPTRMVDWKSLRRVTPGAFMIKKCLLGVHSLALQTSRNLLQYFPVGSQIQEDYLDGNDTGPSWTCRNIGSGHRSSALRARTIPHSHLPCLSAFIEK